MSDDDDSHSSVRSLGDVAEAEEEELVIPHAASSSDSEDSASAVPTSITLQTENTLTLPVHSQTDRV